MKNKILLTDIELECAHHNKMVVIMDGCRKVICFHCKEIVESEELEGNGI